MRKIQFIKTRLYFILAVLLLTAVGIVVYTSVRNDEKQPDRHSYDLAQEQTTGKEDEAENVQQVSSTPYPGESVQSQPSGERRHLTAQTEPIETTYRVGVIDGYLQVYVVQTGKIYMETGIPYDLLPARVQAQIDEGKYFESEEALLEFLENYSS